MAIQTTRLAVWGGPGPRYAPDASVFDRPIVDVPRRVADVVFPQSTLDLTPVITQQAQLYDAGVVLLVQMTKQSDGTPLDVSQATAIAVKVGYPDGTTRDFAGQLYTDGLDGKIFYTTTADDLDQIGTCTLQGEVDLDGGRLSSTVGRFNVKANVDDNDA